jgi:hypothetical protein
VNILDENIPIDQCGFLRRWRIPVRHLGHDLSQSGIQDDEIIPLLCQWRRPTFFTCDGDFYDWKLCHARYCLVYLAVEKGGVAIFVRRLLRHPEFNTEAKRVGAVIRAAHYGLSYWRLRVNHESRVKWIR